MNENKKPEVLERAGAAVNSASLRMTGRQPGSETPLQLVTALGAASLAVSLGADRERTPIAGMSFEAQVASRSMRDLMLGPPTPDRRDQLVGRLAPLLIRIRYGRQESSIGEAGDAIR